MHPAKGNAGWLVVLAAYWALQALYVLSPVDLIPDFVPVFGFADDLVGLLAGLGISAWTVHRQLARPALPQVEPYGR
jgi:uncharacterized membrane protein YkvA (DUF1232 family)